MQGLYPILEINMETRSIFLILNNLEIIFLELKATFEEIYPNFNIAYSYKTNYTPKFCKNCE